MYVAVAGWVAVSSTRHLPSLERWTGETTHLRLMRGTDKNTFQIPLKHNPVFIPQSEQ